MPWVVDWPKYLAISNDSLVSSALFELLNEDWVKDVNQGGYKINRQGPSYSFCQRPPVYQEEHFHRRTIPSGPSPESELL